MPASPSRPWLYLPDGEVVERLEWLTDVLLSSRGNEQRFRLRGYPRRYFETPQLISGRERRDAENLLYGWLPGTWALPVWMDSDTLAADLAIGATAISLDTTSRDYAAGNALVLMADSRSFEIAVIDTVADDGVTLSDPLAGAWPAGTRVAPVRDCRLQSPQSLMRFSGEVIKGTAQWQCIDIQDWPARDETADLYRDYPIMPFVTSWSTDVTQDYVRKLAVADFSLTTPLLDEESDGSILLQQESYTLIGRSLIDAFRRWLYARAGRLNAYWLPSRALDLVVAASATADSISLDIEHARYTSEVDLQLGRRDLRITLRDGTSLIRRVIASEVISPAVERLTLDSALSVDITPATVAAIEWLHLMRLDSDTVELRWWKHDVVTTQLVSRGMRNVV